MRTLRHIHARTRARGRGYTHTHIVYTIVSNLWHNLVVARCLKSPICISMRKVFASPSLWHRPTIRLFTSGRQLFYNSLFPAHQSQTKYFRQTFRQMYLWPHQLQKTNDKKSNLRCMKKRDCSTDANLKTVHANFLTRLHRTWVWWTRTKKRKLNRFSVQNLETIVWKKKKKKKKEKRKRKRKWKNEFVLHELTKAVLKLHSTKWSAKSWGALIQRLCSFLAASGGF